MNKIIFWEILSMAMGRSLTFDVISRRSAALHSLWYTKVNTGFPDLPINKYSLHPADDTTDVKHRDNERDNTSRSCYYWHYTYVYVTVYNVYLHSLTIISYFLRLHSLLVRSWVSNTRATSNSHWQLDLIF